ncbi:MAG: alpha/beta fold hydrolase [Bdellovibrionales bacterium]
MKLSYEKYSGLSKQDVLFIHGNLASTAWWEPTVKDWKKQGGVGTGDVIMADWRGCGKNPAWPADQAFTLEDLAKDYLSLLKDLGKNEVTVVGHSLGGLIALQMMVLEPRRITRAVFLDPVGAKGVVFDESMYEAFRQMAASRELTQTVIFSTIRNQDHVQGEYRERITDDAFKAVKGIGTSVLEILKTVDLMSAAEKIKIPTLILHGQHDEIIPLKDSQALAAAMPNAQLEILPDAGHCWNVENPSEFVKRLRDWF